MSYASANRNYKNRFNLSEAFLDKTGKNLNESLDTKERVLPHRRLVNIEEAERVLRALQQEVSWNVFNSTKYWRHAHNDVNDVIMKLGIHKMQQVLKRDFINGWNNMDFYMYMSASFRLFLLVNIPPRTGKNLKESLDTKERVLRNKQQVFRSFPWSYGIVEIGTGRNVEYHRKLRLEEELMASKRALHNLDRVHDTYCNAVLW